MCMSVCVCIREGGCRYIVSLCDFGSVAEVFATENFPMIINVYCILVP